MAIDLADYGKLEESISDMVFRNECHIKLLKEKREIAYTMAVDIEVETISFSLYENGKSQPPIQFYGYAELVFQDNLSLEIPIHFPRQRIYQAYQWEALRQWQEYVPFIASRQYHRNTVLQIEAIKGALNIPATVEVEASLWDTRWIELPLREIHVRLAENSQFSISYSQYQPVPFSDPFSPVPKQRDGKSNQMDGEKDSGLPSDGIQPRRNPSDNPYKDNDQPSSDSQLTNNGFSRLSSSNLLDPNSDALTPTTPVTWVVKYSFSPPDAADGCGVLRPAGETRTFEGLYGDSWSFPDCEPRGGLNGFCFFQNGVNRGNTYICNPSVVSFESLLPYKRV